MARLALLAALVVVVTRTPGDPAAAGGKKHAGDHAAHMQQCAKACADCMRECDMCARYCADLVAQGKKDHLHTLGTCLDCAEFCASAARIVSRNGPMVNTICEACAKACDVCGAACEKHSGDAHMQRCAKACRDCAAACREMLKHAPAGTTTATPK